jgi:sugar lactone lactonase YvrE
VFCVLLTALPGWAQVPAVSSTGSQAPVPTAGLNQPWAVAVDTVGNLYIADNSNYRVVKIAAADGTQTTLAYLQGRPTGIAVDKAGNVFVSDWDNDQVVKIAAGSNTAVPLITNLYHPYGLAVDSSGNLFVADYQDYEVWRVPAGTSNKTSFSKISTTAIGVTVDNSGNLFVVDDSNRRIAEVPAGNPGATPSYIQVNDSGVPLSVAADPMGNLYVLQNNGKLLELAAGTWVQSTVLTVPLFNGGEQPQSVYVDAAGNVYIADTYHNQILKLSLGPVGFGTVAVGQTASALLGFAFNTDTYLAWASAVAQGTANLDFAVANGGACVFGQAYSAGSTCTINVSFTPLAVGTRLGALNLFDNGGHLLISVPISGSGTAPVVVFPPGIVSTVAGTTLAPFYGYNGDKIPATTAELYSPYSVAGDAAGNLYIADSQNETIRVVCNTSTGAFCAGKSPGDIYNLAGDQTKAPGPTGDGGPAASATLNWPKGVAVDGAGNLFIGDNSLFIRRIAAASTEAMGDHVITTVAGSGSDGAYGDNGDGGPPLQAGMSATAVAVDPAGNLFIADQFNNRIRVVCAISTGFFCGGKTVGYIYTAAGNGPASSEGTPGYGGDDGPATSASLNWPNSVALDAAGNLFISDSQNFRLRVVCASSTGPFCSGQTVGDIYTVAGNGIQGYSGDGGLAIDAELDYPAMIAVDAAGNLYLTDEDGQVRKVDTTGVIATAAGGVYNLSLCSAATDSLGDGCPATSAHFDDPYGLATDAGGNLYITTVGSHHNVREVDLADVPALTFPAMMAGQTSATQTVTIENRGNAPLNFTAITPSNAALDSGVTTCSVSTPVAVGASCVLGVQFAPLAGTAGQGSVVLTDNAANSPQTIPLSGPVIAQLAFTAPPPLALLAGGNAGVVAFALLDALGAPVNVAAAVTLEAFAPDGSQQTYLGATVGGVATFDLSAVPLIQVGAYRYAASAPDFGLAAVATANVLPYASSFGAAAVGLPSGAQAYTLTLPGGGTVITVSVLTQGSPNLDFQEASDTCAGHSFSPGATCTVNVTFTPQYPGMRMGAIMLQDASGTVLATAYLNGLGSGALMDLANWGGPTVGSGLNNPHGVAVDAAGNVYAADTGNHQVVEIPVGGGSQFVVASGLSSPQGLAVDGAGNLYIADSGSSQVKVWLASSGTLGTVGHGFNAPQGVAVDGAGNLYVADTGNNRIVKVPPGGGPAAIVTGLNAPEAVAVDAVGNLYIADTGNHQVLENLAGSGTQFTLLSGFNGGLVSPSGIAVDAAGDFYVVDRATEKIHGWWGTVSSTSFSSTVAIAIDGSGTLYLANTQGSGISELVQSSFPSNSSYVLAPAVVGFASALQYLLNVQNIGTLPLQFSGVSSDNPAFTPAPGSGVCAVENWVAAGKSCALSVIFAPVSSGSQGAHITLTGNAQNSPQTINVGATAIPAFTQLVFTTPTPATVTVGGNPGAIQVTLEDSSGGTVDVSGVSLNLTVTAPDSTTQSYNNYAYGGVATFDLSALALTQLGTYSFTVSFSGLSPATATTDVVSPFQNSFGSTSVGEPTLAQTFTLTFSNGGTVSAVKVLTQGAPDLDFQRVSDNCENNTYAPGDQCWVQVKFSPAYPGLRVGAIVLADSGGQALATAYISGNGDGPLVAFDSNWQQSSGFGSNLNPGGVAIDGAGNVYVSDTTNNLVVKVAGGIQSTVASNLNGPQGLAVDGAGNLYIAGTGNNQIVEVFADGSGQTTTGSGFSGPRGVAVDAAGNVYVADTGNGQVVELPAQGGGQQLIADGLDSPQGLAVDSSGNVYIADPGLVQVVKVLPDGTQSTLCSGEGGPGCSNLTSPAAVAVDAAGIVYIGDGSRVLELHPGGASQTIYGPSGFNLAGLVLDGAGNLYIAESGQLFAREILRSEGPSLNFATTAVGSTSADSPKTVTVDNIGTRSLNFTGVSLDSGDVNFSLSEAWGTCNASTALSAAGSCSVGVSFAPASASTLSPTGSISLTDNAPNSPQTISLTGSLPVIPQIGVAAVTFAGTLVGQSSAQLATITNSGYGTLQIASATLDDTSQFHLGTNNCSAGLSNGQSCTIEVDFAPTAAGAQATNLRIYNNTADNPHTLSLSAVGLASLTQAVLAISPPSLGFGSQTLGNASNAQTVTLTNVGGVTWTPNTLGLGAGSQNDFSIPTTGSSCIQSSAVLSPGASCTLNVVFAPWLAGSRPGSIAITDSSASSPYAIPLSGTGTLPSGVTAAIPAGVYPMRARVNSLTNKIYIANEASNFITVIDGNSNTAVNVDVGGHTDRAAVNEVTNKVYFSNSNGSLTVLNGADNSVTNVSVVDAGVTGTASLSDVVVDAGTSATPRNIVYAAVDASSTNATVPYYVAVVDGASNTVVNKIPLTGQALYGAVNPVTDKIYFSLYFGAKVAVVDGASGTLSYVSDSKGNYWVAVNPITNQVYVNAWDGSNAVTVINGNDNSYVTLAGGASDGGALAVNTVTNKIYSVNSDGTVTVIDGTNDSLQTVTVGTAPFYVTVNEATNQIYVADSGANRISVIDGATNAVSFLPADNPWPIAVNPVTGMIYVGNTRNGSQTGNVFVIAGPVPAGQCAAKPAGMVGWWAAENSGSDSAGANNVTLSPTGASYVTGMVGRAFSFDGTSGFAENTSPDSTLNIGNQSWTISAWANSSDTGATSQEIVSRYACGWNCTSQNGAEYELYLDGTGHATFAVRDSSYSSSAFSASGSTDLRDGGWHLVTGVLDRAATQVEVYVDGALQGNISASGLGDIADPGSPLEIGRLFIQTFSPYHPIDYFNGMIDEVQVYNRALTAAEIQAIHAAGSAGVCTASSPQPATVTLSSMEETYTGSPLSPTVATSPSGLSYTLSGAPQTNAGSYTVTATISDPNYTGSATGTFIIDPAAAAVTLGNMTQTYTSSPLSPTVTTSPSGLSYTLSGAPQTNVGSYTVTATVTDPNYAGSATGTFTLNPVPTCAPQPSGIIGLWPGNGNANDFVAGNNGTLVNGATFASGLAGQTFSLNGANQYVSLPNSVVSANSVWTATAWFKTSSGGVVLGIQDAAYPSSPGHWDPLLYVGTDGKLYGGVWGTGATQVISSQSVADGNWHQAALTLGNNTVGLYLDGTSLGSVQGALQSGMLVNQIGTGYSVFWPSAANGWFAFNGQIADFALFNRILSASDVTAIYQAGSAGVCTTGPVLSVSPSSLTFTGTRGGSNPAAQPISIGNSGTGTLAWTATKTQAWLSLDTTEGTGAGSIQASVDMTGLNAGTYNDTISIPATEASGSPATVAVKLIVNPTTASLTLGNLEQPYSGSALSPSVTTSPSGLSYTLTGAAQTGAGSYPVTATITDPNYTGSATGTFIIDPVTVTVSGIAANNKVYDGTPAATLSGTASLSGVVAGDTVTLAGTAAGTFASATVGTAKVVNVSGLSLTGGSASNYVLTPPVLAANVLPATLTVTASNASRTYGSANPTFGYQVAGLVNGETTAVLTILPVCSTTAVVSSPVGSYPITCTGAAATDYTFSYVPGTLTVLVGSPVPAIASYDWQNAVSASGSPGYLLVLTGTGFVPSTVVQWQPAGTSLVTTLTPTQVTSTQVTAFVPSSLVEGQVSVTAWTPPPGGGESNAITLDVLQGDWTLAVSPSLATVTRGQSVAFQVKVTPQSGTLGQVQLACSGLPAGATCTFSPATLTPGAQGSTSTLTIATSSVSAAIRSPGRKLRAAWMLGFAAPFAVFILPGQSRRRRLLWLMASIALLVVAGAFGCGGGGTSSWQSSSASPATVIVQATSGAVQHSANISLTIQ